MNKKVKIGGLNYDLSYKDLGKDKYGNQGLGECDYDKTKLFLSSKIPMSSDRKLDVFMHECIHALIHESNARHCIKRGKMEPFVCSMSANLAAFIRDNITLIRKMGKF